MPESFAPDACCIVVLHASGAEKVAAWKVRLNALKDSGIVKRVIVVSTGGHPSDEEKGIAEDALFKWGVHNQEAIHPQHLGNDCAQRSTFLELLELP
jgi:hypothetical protein